MRVLNDMGINIKYQKDCKSAVILSEECRIRERSGIQYENGSSRYRICRLSIATVLSRHHEVMAVDIIPEKVELINQRKSPIQDNTSKNI